MELQEIIQKYEVFIGKDNFQLKNIDHLKSIHNIDFKNTPGYQTLSQDAKEAYRNFIFNFFNAWGLETRSKIVPCGIHNTLERTYYEDIKQYKYGVSLDCEHMAIDSEGKELFTIYSQHGTKKSWSQNKVLKKENTFLRFDYEINNNRGWVHVSNGGFTWY